MTRIQTSFGQPGVYNSGLLSLSDGQAGAIQLDAAGNTKGTLATLLAGEDLANNVIKAEQRFTYATVSTGATTVIKSGSGFIHTLTILGGTAGAITVYDNTAASGTAICPVFTPTSVGVPVTLVLDESFLIGLTIVTGAATVLNVSYR